MFEARRHTRREWTLKIDRIDHIEGLLAVHDGRVDLGIVPSTSAARDRFERRRAQAATTQLGQQRRRDMRFANARCRCQL